MGSDAPTPGAGGLRGPRRSWGYWTEAKLELLGRYLDAFTTATSLKASERIYLDAFAGEGRGVSRTTGEEFESSPRIALSIQNPPFTRLRFFELGRKATRLQQELEADFPGRDLRVVAGDCNLTIPAVLDELRRAGLVWAPTFAFLDPDGMELHWDTIVALADHKRDQKFKVELWVLLNTPGLMRVLRKDPDELRQHEEAIATRLFGNERWAAIQALRFDDDITPTEAREEFLNLFRWQLERDLGYRSTHALEIKNLRGQPLYHMVFATDNEAGDRIMSDLYNRAARELPAMRQEVIDRIRGQMSLDFDDIVEGPTDVYRPEPPWEPPS